MVSLRWRQGAQALQGAPLTLLTGFGEDPTFGPGSSNTWHRHRFVCAPRGPLVSRFLFEPVSGRGDEGRTFPGQCPLVLRFGRYGKGKGEVVQRREGLWLYRAGAGSGRVRLLHVDPDSWSPVPCRG